MNKRVNQLNITVKKYGILMAMLYSDPTQIGADLFFRQILISNIEEEMSNYPKIVIPAVIII